MQKITPVILGGGSGTRLWPLSRRSYPKQFAPLIGEHSLFQQSAARLSGGSDAFSFAPPLVMTNSDFRFIVGEQLEQIGITSGTILIEPEARNTAAAVLAAALHCAAEDPDSILLVAPSDHVLPDPARFHQAVERGLKAVREGRLVTFGITPDRAETGYGYLELAAAPGQDGDAIALKRFVEKPDADTAARMLAEGRYLWNAGIFLMSARDILAAFETHAPDLVEPARAAVLNARKDLDFVRLDPEPWARLRDISIDYAVMEKADNLSVVPYDGKWSDLGNWHAVWREAGPDDGGMVTHGPSHALDCTNSLLRSESENVELVGIGLDNILAVATDDAVLIADMSRAQEVGKAVEILRAQGVRQADAFARDHRPWGNFQTLALADRFQVKRIEVKPGGILSLQSHHHRAEHWIVVAGTARVTVGDTVQLVTENQSIYVPLGTRHRLENPGKVPMVLIEVQTGAYLGEDDIIRHEDVYAREERPES